MVAASKILELLPEGYGYVMLTFVDSILINVWMASNVMKARKEHNVKVCTLINFLSIGLSNTLIMSWCT